MRCRLNSEGFPALDFRIQFSNGRKVRQVSSLICRPSSTPANLWDLYRLAVAAQVRRCSNSGVDCTMGEVRKPRKWSPALNSIDDAGGTVQYK